MPEHLPDNEPDLLRRIAAGDERAFNYIYNFYSGTVFNTVMTYVKDKLEAEEILQQIFVKFWERRATLAGVRSLRDYFFISARNAVFNHFNRLSKNARLVNNVKDNLTTVVNNTDHRVREKEYNQLLENAIRQLPPQQKQVYLLADRQDFSNEEIATQMGLSRLTVKKHLELARKFVRNHINNHLQGYTPLLLLVLSLATLSPAILFFRNIHTKHLLQLF
ncbi:sigma-70 family RNA polymerase sigma factor [Chitinophaga sp. MM2321]|uniref:RNA polymerase sigma factor n=1 Tax=Chitinophaga sp. MM2321 TaxID=3137178 RepID=UPI0032D599E9